MFTEGSFVSIEISYNISHVEYCNSAPLFAKFVTNQIQAVAILPSSLMTSVVQVS